MTDTFNKHFLSVNAFCPRIKQAGKFSLPPTVLQNKMPVTHRTDTNKPK